MEKNQRTLYYISGNLFADEKMCDEKLDEISSLAKEINPSLDDNDQQTMKEKLDNLRLRFKQVSDAAKTKEQDLRDGSQQWKDYQVKSMGRK